MTAAEKMGTGTAVPLKGIRRTAARRMISAWEAPVFHLDVEVDMSAALAAKNQTDGATVTDILLASCAQALLSHPALNAHYADEVVTLFDEVNLGIAVATDAGLVVPVVHGADQLDAAGLAAARPRGRRQGARRQTKHAGRHRRHFHRVEPRHDGHRPVRRDPQCAAK